jgi:dymeclin
MGSANLIFITRCILKDLIEQLTPQQLSAFITIPPALRTSSLPSPAVTPTSASSVSPTSPTNYSDEFSDLGEHSLVEALTRATLTALSSPLPPTTTSPSYLFQLESIRFLLVLASSQLYSPTAHPQPTGTSPFLDTAMQAAADLAPAAVAGLLHRFIVDPTPPLSLRLHVTTTYTQAVYQTVRSAASTVWWIPYQAYSYVLKPRDDHNNNNKPAEGALAEACLLALLALVFHAPAAPLQQQGMMNGGGGGAGAYPRVSNPYLLALRQLKDSDDVGCESAAEDGRAPPTTTGTSRAESGSTVINSTALATRTTTVSFGSLYTALGRSLKGEAGLLLCYALLHKNATFHEFCLARSDIEVLLMPLLEALYKAPDQTTNQLYMLLIITLILSQDSAFAQNVHRVSIPSVPFYKEKIINKTTLGSLLVLLLLRTAHHNLATMKDVYLHTNTLAALANLAPYVSGLSSHASQRMVSLFTMLAKKYNRLVSQQQSSLHQILHQEVGKGQEKDEKKLRESKELEIQLYADFLRIVLEIINSILSNALQQNPELVYMLLQQAEVFEPWANHPRYAELMTNITTVISFFNKKLQDPVVADQIGHGTSVMTTNNNGALPQTNKSKDTPQQQVMIMRSAEKVLEAIKLATRGWRNEKLRQIPELRFNYEEEANPEEFFVPYVWSLIVLRGGVPFTLKAISLFRSGGHGETE